MGYKMPPVVPRLQVTFLERHIEKKLDERGIELRESIEKGARAKKEQYFQDKVPNGFTDSVKQAKEKIENIHSAVRAEALEIDGSLGPLLEKKTRASFKISSNFWRKQSSEGLKKKKTIFCVILTKFKQASNL